MLSDIILLIILWASLCDAWSARLPALRYNYSPLTALAAPATGTTQCRKNPHSKVNDLWIVGAGHLGGLVAQEWRRRYPTSTIIAETATSARHDVLRQVGATPRLRAERGDSDLYSSENVLICIPPSTGAPNTISDEVEAACRLWVGAMPGGAPMPRIGSVLYTSSTVVYGEDTNGEIDELSSISTKTEREKRQNGAEMAVRLHDGVIIRLAGLYSAHRGAHVYWLKSKTGEFLDDGKLVNLIHYNDAARAVVSAIERGKRNEVYLVSDDKPMMKTDILAAALASGRYPKYSLHLSSRPKNGTGKKTNSEKTRRDLKWEPVYRDFKSYVMGEFDR